ncbi:TetR/AcrR family transcriptional regulator [Sedimentibacter saalensis]|jgi:AcrR family transcriptional regulator|uniref:TetR/AcrR family transcriptional regulator n=1 Tax=Sedimentibacter saalensis TaxID=130788 RepID=UPI00289709BD|nr:TetR/AcrR family transcriptional regulator [Sedimentibacter saalensis]MEA5094750.1 TetR/AcrR family transcriptional regulator [Sedimentibacter saalensis]
MLDNSKKDKIVQASIEEFSEHGFEKANTDRISQRAEVSKGLIFHYFGSKENLFMTAMNKCIDDALNEFKDLELPKDDFITILMKLMEVKYKFFMNNPMHYRMLVGGFSNSPKKLKADIEKRYMEIKQIGINILMDIIKGLPMKKNIEANDIVLLMASLTNIIESRYLPLFAEDGSNYEKYYDVVKDEYIRLMNILMYGILEER